MNSLPPDAAPGPAAAAPDADGVSVDIAIIGAGPVGLALAGALARHSATAGLSITLIDARTRAAADSDPRVLALSHGSRTLLAPIGWPEQATPIETIHVSQRGYLGRALIRHETHHLPALGYVVRYGAIAGALRAGVLRLAERPGRTTRTALTLLEQCTATAIAEDADGVLLRLASTAPGPTENAKPMRAPSPASTPIDTTRAGVALPSRLRARLVIHAEGTRPGAHRANTAQDRVRNYTQTAIVGAVRTDAPLPRVAWERFTDEGPLALLPLAESGVQCPPAASATPGVRGDGAAAPADYALVWCQSPERAAARIALDDDAFLADLHQAFGDRLGRFTRISGRATFDLHLRASGALAEGRIATIGNAAQTLHPVAGQGLNLGVRDAEALALAIGRHGTTPGALTAFAASRSWDRRLTIGLTDALARGFTHPFPPLGHLRGVALAALDCLPGAKGWLARQMMFGQRT